MRKSTKKEFVAKHLDLIFSTVKHTSQLEREVCFSKRSVKMCICIPEELICTLLGLVDFTGMCNSCWIHCCVAFRLGDCKTGQHHEKRCW